MNNQYMKIVEENTRQEITYRFIPKPHEDFWYVNPWNGNIVKLTRTPNDYNYKFAKCFETEEEAQKHLDFLLAEDFLKQKAFELNDKWEPNWDDTLEAKYFIYLNSQLLLNYNSHRSIFGIDYHYSYINDPNMIFLKDHQTAHTIINRYSKELKTYFGIKDE